MEKPITIRTKTIQKNKPQIKVEYPVVVHFSDLDIQHKMNTSIVHTLNSILIKQNYHSQELVELIASYEIKTNERGILSLNLIVYSFTGGAHGMTIVKSLNFNTKTGQLLQLSDLFKNDQMYIHTISEIIQHDIHKWKIDVIEPFNKIEPNQDFYLADSSIVIYFQLYELAPYVYGFPYFPIALLDLQEDIGKQSVLQTLLPFTPG